MKSIFKQSGFSILEMLVVISIIGFLSTIVLVNYQDVGRKSAVSVAAQNLASDIRRAQSYALNGKTAHSQNFWGIRFSNNPTSNTSYTIYTTGTMYDYHSSDDVFTVDLPKNVKIKYFESLGVDAENRYIEVYFTPPNATVAIKNGSGSITSDIIILSDLDGNYEKRIFVNSFGLIDIEN